MSAFDTAIDTLYADSNFGVDAVYFPSNGISINVRVIAKQPDEIVGFGDTQIHTETSLFEVQTRRPSFC